MIEIIDNCVPVNHLRHMQSIMLNDSFPWFFNNTKVGFDVPAEQENYDCQFVHLFYKNLAPSSNFGDLIEPVLDVLRPSALIRIKANLTTCADGIYKYPPHVDLFDFDGKTAIFYLNTNNGYTEFDDGTKLESIENSLILFEGNQRHRAVGCTDENIRVNININWMEDYHIEDSKRTW